MNKKISKLNIIFYIVWIIVTLVLINLPNIMGDKFSLNKGKGLMCLFLICSPIIYYLINNKTQKNDI